MIRLEKLTKRFGDTTAVEGLDLDISRGEVFGLLGPNGAGKTTTVNMIVGLISPDEGSVEIAGLGSPANTKARAAVGVAPQALSLYEELTAEENLLFFGRMQGLSGERLKERVSWALEFAQLSSRRRDKIANYSGGMKRRINLAVALVHDPPILLLDEPTVGVDPQSRNSIFDSIEQLKEEGRTVLYTTHYMEEAQRLCDRVAIMDQGRLLALDTVAQLIRTHGGKSVVTVDREGGETRVETDDPMSELVNMRDDKSVVRFGVEGPNLESVFLHLTGRHLRD